MESMDKKLKICFVQNTLSNGGAERQVLILCKWLQRNGHGVSLIYYRKIEDIKPEYDAAGIDCRLIDAGRLGRLRTILHMSRFIHYRKFDVDICFHGTSNIYGGLAGRLARCKKIIGGWQGGWHGKGRRYIFKRLIVYLSDKFIDYWIVNAKTNAREIHYCAPIKKSVYLLHNAMEFTPENSQLPTVRNGDELLVVTVGRITPVKNFELFIKIARRCLKDFPKSKWCIVGGTSSNIADKKYFTGLKELVNGDSLLKSSFSFLGYRDDIPSLLSKADVNIITSNHEGLPNALIEAMRAGVPSVTTNCADLWFFRDGTDGLIFPVDDIDRGYSSTLELLSDPEKRLRFGKAGQLQCRKYFDIEIIGPTLLKIINSHDKVRELSI